MTLYLMSKFIDCHFNVECQLQYCPTKWKRSICISDFMQTNFFYLGKFLKKLSNEQYSLITKGSIYHIKHTPIQPFTMSFKMEVSIMFNIWRYSIFTWYWKIFISPSQIFHEYWVSVMMYTHTNYTLVTCNAYPIAPSCTAFVLCRSSSTISTKWVHS